MSSQTFGVEENALTFSSSFFTILIGISELYCRDMDILLISEVEKKIFFNFKGLHGHNEFWGYIIFGKKKRFFLILRICMDTMNFWVIPFLIIVCIFTKWPYLDQDRKSEGTSMCAI